MSLRFEQHYRPTDTAGGTYNIPAGRRAAERTVVRAVSLLTPNEKCFEVLPGFDVLPEIVANCDKFMDYILRRKIRSRSNINLLVRSMFMYGICILKTSVQVRNGQVWPYQRVVDPFAFYIFPETSESVDHAELIFEDFLFSYERYNALAQKGLVSEIKRSDVTEPTWPYHLTERLAYQGITTPSADLSTQLDRVGDELQRIGAGFISLSELWLPRNDKLYQVHIAWNVTGGPRIVNFVQSEYDEPMYRTALHRPLAGETYTNSMMDDLTELDNVQNDTFNQFKDAVDWEQGFVAVDESESAGSRKDTWKMKGRAKWSLGGNPREILNLLQPNQTSTNQLRAWQIELGLINALAGTGTIAEGQPGRNMPRAGGAVNTLINLSMADVQDMAELVEQEVLTPSLYDIYKVSMQFIPDSQLMRIAGAKANYTGGVVSSVIRRKDIAGDFDFEWVGAQQSQDDQARSQKLLIFFNLLSQPQILRSLQQQGYVPDFAEFVRYLWRYTLGERGLSNIIIPVSQLQQKVAPEQGQPEPEQHQQGNNGVSSNGMAGLQYELPSLTSGFLQQS
jgi:hypothetical protein